MALMSMVFAESPAVAACAIESYHDAAVAVAAGVMEQELDAHHSDMVGRGIWNSGIHYGGDRDIAESYEWTWDEATCSFNMPVSTTTTTSTTTVGTTSTTSSTTTTSTTSSTTTTTTIVGGANSFVDDDGSVFEVDIEWLAESGISQGCNPPINDLFCPDASVTRGQMAAFLVRALNLPATNYSPYYGYFSDDDGSIFESEINDLAASGITSGCGTDLFCPNNPVTRGQMAAFLVRALGYTDDGGGDLFTDDDTSIFEADIDKLAVAKVTLGCNPPTNTLFCPTANVTRGQMAAFLHRALGD